MRSAASLAKTCSSMTLFLTAKCFGSMALGRAAVTTATATPVWNEARTAVSPCRRTLTLPARSTSTWPASFDSKRHSPGDVAFRAVAEGRLDLQVGRLAGREGQPLGEDAEVREGRVGLAGAGRAGTDPGEQDGVSLAVLAEQLAADVRGFAAGLTEQRAVHGIGDIDPAGEEFAAFSHS